MHKYLRYWYLFLIGIIFSVVAANLYLRYYATPQYSISSTLLIKENDGQSNLSANAFGEAQTSTSKNINDEIQLLKSKSLMQRVVNNLSLYTGYQIEDKVKKTELYGRDLPVKTIINRIDSTAYGQQFIIHIKSDRSFELSDPTTGQTSLYEFGQLIHRPYGEFTILPVTGSPYSSNDKPNRLTVTLLNPRKLADHYSRILSVLPVNKDANVLTLSFTDALPQRGLDIMNQLLYLYNREGQEDKNQLAANSLAFIDERLKRLTASLSGVERNVEQYKRQNGVTDVNSQVSDYLAQASDYQKRLSEWAIQIDILESIEEYLNKNSNQFKIVPSTLGLQDQTLMGLINRFNDLQLERERMLRTAQANNPLVQSVNEQLSNLRTNILENLHNIKTGLVITSRNLKSNSGQYQNQIRKVPSIERELLEINRQQATKQTLYLYLLQKREEAALSLAATVAKSKIIDSAIVSDQPISPNPKLMYLLALLVGLGLPFTFIYTKDKLNNKIQTQQDVEQLTNSPILGELAHNKQGTVVVTRGNFSPITEMFGLVRAHLNIATAHYPKKVLLVTSSMSGEGKTFFSINMAASLALTGKKVIILELDFRVPNLLSEMGLHEGAGIADYLLSNEISIADIISPVEKVPNLFVAGAGARPLNPAELMTSSKLAYLINELKMSFEYIIIDTAPVGQVADAFGLSPLTDATIYLMRYNYTEKTQVALVDKIYKDKTLPNPLIVLNDAKKQNGNYRYTYDQVKKKPKRAFKLN